MISPLVILLSLQLLFHNGACFQINSRVGSTSTRTSNGRRVVVPLGSSTANVNEEAAPASLSGPPAITVRDVTCSFDGGDTYQLQEAGYILPRGARVGLVGRNGCGKSTFLKILAESSGGTENERARDNVPYTGEVECPRDITVAFVEQEPPSPSDITVSDALLGVTHLTQQSSSGSGSTSTVYEIVRDYRVASFNAATDPDAFANAASAMDANNGWAVLTKAEEVLTRLRVRHLEDQPLSSLSGGERKRVALAAALVKEPDVLICDEPTNHLDLAAIQWLSDLINDKKKMTFLTVTHDRAFLEDVCNTILELDRGQFYTYEGSYARYLEGKEERLANEDQLFKERKAKLKKELEWMRRQPQARQTKQKAREQAFYKLEKSTKPRVKDPKLELNDDGQRRMGGNVLKMRDVSLSFGDNKMLSDFSYDFNKGDRIGIVGRNGVGKSTFIRMLTGDQAVDSGTITAGDTVVFGKYDQMGIPFLDENQSVLEFVKERVESSSGASMAEAPQEAMKLLKQFQFPRQRWNERVSMLSGGERRRLQLLSVLTKRPNFLILDEPTNDVDLDTLRALEGYLEDFKGVLVIVSHDRSFTDKVTDHLFVFEGNGVVKDYLGSLSDYAACLVEQEKEVESSGSLVDSDTKKASYKEDKQKRLERRNAMKKMKRDLGKIEPAIEKLKKKAEGVQAEIDDSAEEGWTVLADLTDNLQKINDEIEEKELEWLEIAESLETLEEEESAASS
mmetsp:Transcript_3611/g.7967  ORF Transcript_3611/g.7967 Transcript_3611/m.7967 type:complete len:736 (+) Transcript_3611:101-2308(+)|eukprot:CAMPEP_0183775360 /NCGR_PEP_ID=MMETSP0739-20130205/44345_1 /TAXON_ID=385413 /ORGANISM="Thalassiosira miniscula, Strain CCMP1093" /LENGTH=735 /DNA_ID=CAMNT_0026016939 /DNA_START=22 /DNA_END=2229 /DNA_ORIENTATION=-